MRGTRARPQSAFLLCVPQFPRSPNPVPPPPRTPLSPSAAAALGVCSSLSPPPRPARPGPLPAALHIFPDCPFFPASRCSQLLPSSDPPPPLRTAAAIGTSPPASRSRAPALRGRGRQTVRRSAPKRGEAPGRTAERSGIPTCACGALPRGRAEASGSCGFGVPRMWDAAALGILRIWDPGAFGDPRIGMQQLLGS